MDDKLAVILMAVLCCATFAAVVCLAEAGVLAWQILLHSV
jgi:hypothetical protein